MRFAACLGVCAVAGLFASLAVNLPQPSDAGQPRQSLLYPRSAPLASLSLAQLERWQQRALSHYRGAYRVHERVAARRALTRTEWTHRRWYRLATAWTARELGETRERIRLRREYAEAQRQQSSPRAAICSAFGAECAKAIRVAECESGLNVYAVGNRYGSDPYYGLFQQGAYSRSTYGFGWSAIEQAQAAKRHRDAEGWGPWPICGQR